MRPIAFIPARSGSKRIPRKALADLGGKPLIVWTIEAAYRAGLQGVVATDDAEIAHASLKLGPDPDLSIFYRESAPDDEPDIVWVQKALDAYPEANPFLILRPTSPFRSANTITRAMKEWRTVEELADSMRSVTRVSQHPAKMWQLHSNPIHMTTVLYGGGTSASGLRTPWHSMPTQLLPDVYVQTAGLEIAHRRVAYADSPTIAGEVIVPFFLSGLEALDINTPEDLERARSVIDVWSPEKVTE